MIEPTSEKQKDDIFLRAKRARAKRASLYNEATRKGLLLIFTLHLAPYWCLSGEQEHSSPL